MKTWKTIFTEINKKEYFQDLIQFINNENRHHVIFPPKHDIFNAFRLTPFESIKVVIFGQDPYPNKGQAMGLAFGVNKGVDLPPSLRNIYKEIENEFNVKMNYQSGDLTYLATQGVLLLNAILTVREKAPLSHDNELYRLLFKDLIYYIEQNNNPIVYILLGRKSQQYKKYITNPNHFIVEANHPSPLSANVGGFFNSNIFIKTNNFLKNNNINPIDWQNK